MKRQIVVVVLAVALAVLLVEKASAGTASATASTTTSAQAQANGNSFNASLGLSTGSSSANVGNVSTGASTSNANVGSVSTGASTSQVGNVSTGASTSNVGSVSTGASTSQVGATSASVGGLQNNLSISSEATRIPLGTPNAILPSIPTAQIFGDDGDQPGNVQGIPLILAAMQQCNFVATQRHPLRVVKTKGRSGTQIEFSPSRNYALAEDSPSYSSSSGGSSMPWDFSGSSGSSATARTRGGARSAQVLFPSEPGAWTYDCQGVIVATAEPGESFPAMNSDVRDKALQDMSGVSGKDVFLVSVPDAIAKAKAINTSGSGMGVSPGIVGSAANMLTGGMISAGVGTGKGNTGRAAELGCTYCVLTRAAKDTGVVIDPGKIRRYYAKPAKK